MDETQSLAVMFQREFGWGFQNSEGSVRAGFKCEYCGKPQLESVDAYFSWEIDHINLNGGEELENIALACRMCNHVKHFHVPKGATRSERIADTLRHIEGQLQLKRDELAQLKELLGVAK